MNNILLVTSSPRGEASHSTRLARELVDRLRAEHPEATLTVRDLSQAPPPLLDEAITGAFFTPEAARTPAQRDLVAISDAYVAELFAADAIVVASGMINFGVPTVLKSWIDQIARSGVTFRYGEAGPEGLVRGKKAYLVLASGGVYSSGPMQALDHQAPYLHATLGFLGITDVETITVEGVAMGPDATQQALDAAHERILALA